MMFTITRGWPLMFRELGEGKKFIANPALSHDDHDNMPYLLLLKLQKGQGKNGENAVRVNDGILIKLTPETEVIPIEVDR